MNKQKFDYPLKNGLKDNCYNNRDTWRCIQDISKEYLKGDYKILFYNLKDSSKFPEKLRFIAFDWENINILVYHEPTVTLYTFDNYEDCLRLIGKSAKNLLNAGLTIASQEDYKRIFLFNELNKHKITELTKGDLKIKVGDFLSTCWGYDQTNTELFIIRKILGKNYFIIQELAQHISESSTTYDMVTVAPQLKNIDIPQKAFINNEGHMSVSELGYKRSLSLTDLNKSHYKTNTQFGH